MNNSIRHNIVEFYQTLQRDENHRLLSMWMRTQHVTMLVIFLLATSIGAAQSHDIPEHGLRVNLPLGWQRMEALSGNTILKLARTDTPGKEARIVIVTFLAEESIDLSTISRDDHMRALERGSLLGEKVSALDVGRTQVGGIDALWGKTYRDLPSRGPTYEYTYEFFREYKGIPKGFTIRLTSYGDQDWFRSNSVAFDRFIQSIAFNQRPAVKTPMAPQTEGDPFWVALFKGFGKTFLLILLATIVIGIGKWVYSEYLVSRNSKRDDDANAG